MKNLINKRSITLTAGVFAVMSCVYCLFPGSTRTLPWYYQPRVKDAYRHKMEIECGKHECSSSCMRREQHTTLQVILCDSCFSVVDIEEELLGWDEWEAIDGLCCRIDAHLPE